jgi:hypothetical protein
MELILAAKRLIEHATGSQSYKQFTTVTLESKRGSMNIVAPTTYSASA